MHGEDIKNAQMSKSKSFFNSAAVTAVYSGLQCCEVLCWCLFKFVRQVLALQSLCICPIKAGHLEKIEAQMPLDDKATEL